MSLKHTTTRTTQFRAILFQTGEDSMISRIRVDLPAEPPGVGAAGGLLITRPGRVFRQRARRGGDQDRGHECHANFHEDFFLRFAAETLRIGSVISPDLSSP